MQGADPSHGAAQREMSKTESEGHSSAASFIDSGKEHLPRQSQSLLTLEAAGLQIKVNK
jgi:hypothetical protein